MNVYDIIKKPVVTEKTELLRKEYNKYTFEVHPKANKIEIKKAVETIFNVKVEDVATINKKHNQNTFCSQTNDKLSNNERNMNKYEKVV